VVGQIWPTFSCACKGIPKNTHEQQQAQADVLQKQQNFYQQIFLYVAAVTEGIKNH